MTTSRHHLTLVDLMATVAAAALGMVPLVWDPPPPSVPVPVILFWLIVPLVGIVWDRWRGGSWHTWRGSRRGG
jgi:biotin transporter BioY